MKNKDLKLNSVFVKKYLLNKLSFNICDETKIIDGIIKEVRWIRRDDEIIRKVAQIDHLIMLFFKKINFK